MDLHIMSLFEAIAFQPTKPTNAIQIFSSFWNMEPRLQDSSLYTAIERYTFDDNEGNFESGPVTMSKYDANQLVGSFIDNIHGIEALLVHCGKGESRAPAVAIALNELFNLGQNSEELKRKYNKYNRAVYMKVLNSDHKIK